MEKFGMTDEPTKFRASIVVPGRVSPYRLQCRACGFEPLDAIVAPKRCPKCACRAWERFAFPRSLLMNATRRTPRGAASFQSARNAALEERVRQENQGNIQ